MTGRTLAFLLITATAPALGGWLFLLRRQWQDESLRLLVATGTGFMLAVALIEMFPEAWERARSAPMWVIAGFLVVHLVEHVVTPHFHYGDETHTGLGAHVGVVAVLGLVVHSLIDGVAIVAAVEAGPRLGLLVFLAMVWHTVPSGFTAASVVGATGWGRQGAFAAAVSLGVATFVGGIVYAFLPSQGWLGPALGLSAGSLIYVAATDLLPEVNKRRTPFAPIGVMAGVGVFYALHRILGH